MIDKCFNFFGFFRFLFGQIKHDFERFSRRDRFIASLKLAERQHVRHQRVQIDLLVRQQLLRLVPRAKNAPTVNGADLNRTEHQVLHRILQRNGTLGQSHQHNGASFAQTAKQLLNRRRVPRTLDDLAHAHILSQRQNLLLERALQLASVEHHIGAHRLRHLQLVVHHIARNHRASQRHRLRHGHSHTSNRSTTNDQHRLLFGCLRCASGFTIAVASIIQISLLTRIMRHSQRLQQRSIAP
mmetsp:Transcript_18839/g.30002  ORF Transcript_18839/g.30002 Transcript_18839/m.30002 type:complete len:241 (-) Transcript_18839:997-1719(-)